MSAQELVEPEPHDLSHWGLHCYCVGARWTPHVAIRADNNGRLLYLARNGITRSALEAAGEPCSDSQVLLLQIFGLLGVTGDILHTAFPLLGPDTMRRLRAQSSSQAASVICQIAAAVRQVGATLRSNGLQDHHYAVVFGHGLDDLMWGHLRALRGLPPTQLSVDRPFWNGVFWAVNPKRRHVAGTNQVSRGAETLVTVWSDSSSIGLKAISALWQCGNWAPTVPVIHTATADSIHAACQEIAAVASAALTALLDSVDREAFGGLAQEQLLMVLGHEFIWDVAEHLCQTGHLHEPDALRNGAPGSTDLNSLIYVRLAQ